MNKFNLYYLHFILLFLKHIVPGCSSDVSYPDTELMPRNYHVTLCLPGTFKKYFYLKYEMSSCWWNGITSFRIFHSSPV